MARKTLTDAQEAKLAQWQSVFENVAAYRDWFKSKCSLDQQASADARDRLKTAPILKKIRVEATPYGADKPIVFEQENVTLDQGPALQKRLMAGIYHWVVKRRGEIAQIESPAHLGRKQRRQWERVKHSYAVAEVGRTNALNGRQVPFPEQVGMGRWLVDQRPRPGAEGAQEAPEWPEELRGDIGAVVLPEEPGEPEGARVLAADTSAPVKRRKAR